MIDFKLVNWMFQSISSINLVFRSIDKELLTEVVSYEVKDIVERLIIYYDRHKEVPSYDVMRNLLVKDDLDYEAIRDVARNKTTKNDIGFILDQIKERFNRKKIERFIDGYSDEEDIGDSNKRMRDTLLLAERLNRVDAYSEGLISDSVEERERNYKYTEENPNINKGVISGYKELDDYTFGLKGSEMLTIGGASSSGKSMLMLNMAINAWKGSNDPSKGIFDRTDGSNVVYVSLEMTKSQLEKRIDACLSRVESNNIIRGLMTEQEKVRWGASLRFQKGYGKHFYILDLPRGSSVADMESKFDIINELFHAESIYVDYLQLMSPSSDKSGTDWQDVGKVAEELHEFCKKKDIATVTAAQRKAGDRKGQRNYQDNATLEDLGRSKMIGDNSTVVWIIGKREDELLREDMEVYVVKNRDGAKGKVKLRKAFSQSRIEELPEDWIDEEESPEDV